MRLVIALACLAGCDAVYDLHRPPEDAQITDAPIADAFDRAACPDAYMLRPANLSSAYRIIPTLAAAGPQLQECDGDEPGFTHLVQLDSELEATYLASQLTDVMIAAAWIGAVQPSSSTDPAAGWINVDGSALLSTLWAANEPNDFDGTEDAQENFVRLDASRLFLVDFASFVASPAICECDGRTSAPAFVDVYTQ